MAWTFDELGNIHDGNGNVIKFSEIARVVGTTVVDIQGNPLPISVTDAQSLGGIPFEEMAKVTDIQTTTESVNSVIDGDYPLTYTNTDLVRTQVLYTPKKTIPTLPLLEPELLANSTLNDTGNITIKGNVSFTAAAGVLTVTQLADSGWAGASIPFTVTETGLYAFRVTGAGVNPSMRIYDEAGVVLQTVPVVGEKFLCVTLSSIESYEFVLGGSDVLLNDVTTFTNISFKKVNESLITNGDYYGEVFNSDIETFVKTDIETSDIYGGNVSFSAEPNNNIRVLRDDWTMLQYIDSVPNKGGLTEELLVDSTGRWVGDFSLATDSDVFTPVGSTTVVATGGYLEVSGGVVDERVEVYMDLITVPGETYMFTGYLSTKIGMWNFQMGDKIVPTPTYASTAINLDFPIAVQFGFVATSTTTRFSIWTIGTNDTDILRIAYLTGRKLNSSVWKNITPELPAEETNDFDCINYHITSLATHNPSDTAGYAIEYDSITSDELLRVLNRPDYYYRWSMVLNTDNSGVRMGRSAWLINARGTQHLLTQQSYNKMRMVRLVDGNLAIICTCTATNQTMVHVKDFVLSDKLTFPHGVNGTPVVSVSSPLGIAWGEVYDAATDPNDLYYTIHGTGATSSVNFVAYSTASAINYDKSPVVDETNVYAPIRNTIPHNIFPYRFIGKSPYYFGGVVSYTPNSKKYLGFTPMDIKVKPWNKTGKWTQVARIAGTNVQLTPTGHVPGVSVTRGVVLTDVGYNINVDDVILNTPIGDEYFVESFATNMDGNKLYLDRSTRDTSITGRGRSIAVTTAKHLTKGLNTTAETLNEGELPGVNPLNLK